jgi:hypothetical protein
VTTRGRQYPDGPLVPDPDVIYRPLQQPARLNAGTPDQFWPDVAGEVLHNILSGGGPAPGPQYTHTIVPPEPIGEDEDGNAVYPEPGPAYTLARRPLADVVREAGFGPVPERIKITADFCQCPACRAERREPP